MTNVRSPASHQTVELARGRHLGPEHGVCVMELASMLAGEPFSDHPHSVCPVLAALLRGCNDRFDDGTRRRLYGYASAAVGTGADERASKERAALCAAVLRERRRARFLRRTPTLPHDPLGPEFETFAAAVVRSFPNSAAGHRALLELVDDLLAVRGRPGAPARAGGRAEPTHAHPA